MVTTAAILSELRDAHGTLPVTCPMRWVVSWAVYRQIVALRDGANQYLVHLSDDLEGDDTMTGLPILRDPALETGFQLEVRLHECWQPWRVALMAVAA